MINSCEIYVRTLNYFFSVPIFVFDAANILYFCEIYVRRCIFFIYGEKLWGLVALLATRLKKDWGKGACK